MIRRWCGPSIWISGIGTAIYRLLYTTRCTGACLRSSLLRQKHTLMGEQHPSGCLIEKIIDLRGKFMKPFAPQIHRLTLWPRRRFSDASDGANRRLHSAPNFPFGSPPDHIASTGTPSERWSVDDNRRSLLSTGSKNVIVSWLCGVQDPLSRRVISTTLTSLLTGASQILYLDL